jgi:hypothetical protein
LSTADNQNKYRNTKPEPLIDAQDSLKVPAVENLGARLSSFVSRVSQAQSSGVFALREKPFRLGV